MHGVIGDASRTQNPSAPSFTVKTSTIQSVKLQSTPPPFFVDDGEAGIFQPSLFGEFSLNCKVDTKPSPSSLPRPQHSNFPFTVGC